MTKEGKREQIEKTLKIGKIFLWIGIPISLLSPLIFTQYSGISDFTTTGNIGDTIGGITAPFINILGAILVFLALKAQIQANLIIQDQIDQQELEKRLENESKQLNQYYSNLKSSIDGFKYSTLNTWELGNKENFELIGSDAFYKMFQDFKCSYHDDEDDLKSNPKITELISMLVICDKLLNRINKSDIVDRETLWTLTSHQYLYRIFPRLSLDYPHCIDKYYCEDCKKDHGFPEKLSDLIKSICEQLNNGLQSHV